MHSYFMSCLLGIVLVLPLAGADVNLSVTASGNSGSSLTYVWSVLSTPPGAATPTGLPAAATVSANATVTFANTAMPGAYVFKVQVQDGTAPVVMSTTSINVTRGQIVTFPSGPTSFVYRPGSSVDVDPGATTSAPDLGVVYRVVRGDAATIVGNRLRPRGTGVVTVEADVEPQVPVRYRSQPRQRDYTFTAEALTAQTIEVPSRALSKIKGGAALTFSLDARATSGLGLQCSSSDTAIATVTPEGLVTVLSAGRVVITLRQPGDTRYAAADPVPVTIDITAASIAITTPLSASPAVLDLP